MCALAGLLTHRSTHIPYHPAQNQTSGKTRNTLPAHSGGTASDLHRLPEHQNSVNLAGHSHPSTNEIHQSETMVRRHLPSKRSAENLRPVKQTAFQCDHIQLARSAMPTLAKIGADGSLRTLTKSRSATSCLQSSNRNSPTASPGNTDRVTVCRCGL
jgi:hypothetical protein